MKYFNHTRAESYEQASELVKESPNTVVMAGGTDLVGQLKDNILEKYPERVVDLKSIPDSAGIEVKDGVMTIKAMTKLKDIVESEEVAKHAPILAEAAKSVATPLIRNTGTIGGKLILGSVAPVPIHAVEAEGFLIGREANEETADAAAKLAVKDAIPLSGNQYKVNELEALIKKSIMRMAE